MRLTVKGSEVKVGDRLKGMFEGFQSHRITAIHPVTGQIQYYGEGFPFTQERIDPAVEYVVWREVK